MLKYSFVFCLQLPHLFRMISSFHSIRSHLKPRKFSLWAPSLNTPTGWVPSSQDLFCVHVSNKLFVYGHSFTWQCKKSLFRPLILYNILISFRLINIGKKLGGLINIGKKQVKPLSANPTKWSNTLKSAALADELFECVWPFCGVGA